MEQVVSCQQIGVCAELVRTKTEVQGCVIRKGKSNLYWVDIQS